MRVHGQVGFTKAGQPVLYCDVNMSPSKGLPGAAEHLVAHLERMIAAMPEGVESYSMVADLHGFGLADMKPRVAVSLIPVCIRVACMSLSDPCMHVCMPPVSCAAMILMWAMRADRLVQFLSAISFRSQGLRRVPSLPWLRKAMDIHVHGASCEPYGVG